MSDAPEDYYEPEGPCCDEATRRVFLFMHEQFLEDCINGTLSNGAGGFRPPCSKEEAERIWKNGYGAAIFRHLVKHPGSCNYFRTPEMGSEKYKDTELVPGCVLRRRQKFQRDMKNVLTPDDLIDMWQKAQMMPEPAKAKHIEQIRQLSQEFESKPAALIVDVLLEGVMALT